jgi:hypothetical protein
MMQIALSKVKPEIAVTRRMILDSIRTQIKMFRPQYGNEVVIAVDSGSWRKGVFPYYKQSRAVTKAASAAYDWAEIGRQMSQMAEEIKQNFPYHVIKVRDAEGDDVIGTICRYSSSPIIIVSGDGDMKQLHTKQIQQYSPVLKVHIPAPANKENALLEHIIRGDRGDGVPNMLSQDDCFVTKVRQKKIMPRYLEEVIAKVKAGTRLSDTEQYGFDRNQMLIDLKCTPINMQEEILTQLRKSRETPKRVDLVGYLTKHELHSLQHKIWDF